jgi:hypothetical protein
MFGKINKVGLLFINIVTINNNILFQVLNHDNTTVHRNLFEKKKRQ